MQIKNVIINNINFITFNISTLFLVLFCPDEIGECLIHPSILYMMSNMSIIYNTGLNTGIVSMFSFNPIATAFFNIQIFRFTFSSQKNYFQKLLP